MNHYNKDPTVWLGGVIPPTPVSGPPSWGMGPCSRMVYPLHQLPLVIVPCGKGIVSCTIAEVNLQRKLNNIVIKKCSVYRLKAALFWLTFVLEKDVLFH
jgi:hypothetical protein